MVQVTERTLELRAEQHVMGAVYSLESLGGKLLAGVNNKLQLYEWSAAAAGEYGGGVRAAQTCAGGGERWAAGRARGLGEWCVGPCCDAC